MQTYLRELLPKLKQFSAGLDNRALFTDHPWLRIDEQDERVLFVFRSQDNELLVIRNGDVSTYCWEYLGHLNSLLIEAEGKKSLYQQGFMDETVMIIKKDGVDEFMFLVNENKFATRSTELVLERLNAKYLEAPSSSRKVQEGRKVDESMLAALRTHRFDDNAICRACRVSDSYVKQTGYRCPS